jgi:hypothetical protein
LRGFARIRRGTKGIKAQEHENRWRRGILCPEGGNCGGDFLLEDFDEFLVSVDDFLLGFDLGDALLLITDYADYTDLAIRVYKYMRIYLYSAT